MPAPTPQQHRMPPTYTPTHATHYSQSPAPHIHPQAGPGTGFQPITPHVPFTPQPAAPMQQYQTPRPTPGYQQPYMQQPNYKAPQPIETYILNDAANASIPEDIRAQFQRDEKGRVLFFTAPPLNVPQPLTKDGRALGHSARYLAARAKRAATKSAKRPADTPAGAHPAKRAHVASDAAAHAAITALHTQTVAALERQLAGAAKAEFAALYGRDGMQAGVHRALDCLLAAQADARGAAAAREERVRRREEERRVPVTGMTGRLEETI